MFSTIGSLLFALLAGGLPGAPAATHTQQALRPLSESTFRSDMYEYEYKSGLLRSQDLWVVVGLRARGQLGGPQQYQVWRVDSQGKKLRDVDLTTTSPINRSQTMPARVHELVALKNGNMALLVEMDREAAYLVFDGESGEILVNRAVTALSGDTFISKLFPAADGGLIAVGRSGSSGLMLKFRASGELAASTVVDDKELTVLTDGMELQDHTLLLLGEHLDDAGKTNIWIGKINAQGAVLSKTSFAGQGAAVSCSGHDHNCAVVYANAGSSDWNVSIRVFSDNLTLGGQSDLASGIKISPRYRIIARNDGGFFVAGGNAKNRLWMASVSENGKIATSSTFEEPSVKWQRLWNFDLFSTSQEFVIPITELLVGDELEQRQVVKVLRLQKP